MFVSAMGASFYVGFSMCHLRTCGTGSLFLQEKPHPTRAPEKRHEPPQRGNHPATPQLHLDTVFDLGMGTGDDTRLYLEMGYKVVGLEVNPVYHAKNHKRFEDEIESGRLVLLNRLLGQRAGLKPLPFYVSKVNQEWASFDHRIGCRGDCWQNPQCSNVTKTPPCCWSAHKCEVHKPPVISCSELYEKHGVPLMLKVDVMEQELPCLGALAKFSQRPRYVVTPVNNLTTRYWRLLPQLGYAFVKAVQQKSQSLSKAFGSTSGPFGELAKDCVNDYEWRRFGDVQPTWPTHFSEDRCPNIPGGWFDWQFKQR